MHNPPNAEDPIRIGISACLLDRKVRFDGGHQQDHYLTDTLGEHYQWVPVCPEVEVGLPTPRPTPRLELSDGEFRMVMTKEETETVALLTPTQPITPCHR